MAAAVCAEMSEKEKEEVKEEEEQEGEEDIPQKLDLKAKATCRRPNKYKTYKKSKTCKN